MVKNTLNKAPGDEYTTDDHNKGGTGEVVNYVISAGGTPDANRLDQTQEVTMSYAGGKLNAMFYQDNGSSGTHQLVRPAGPLSTYTNDLTSYVDGLEVKFVSNFAHDGTSLVNVNVRGIGDVPLTGSDNGITYEQGSVLSCLYYSGAFKLLSLDAATSFVNNNGKLRAVLEAQIGQIIANLNPAYQNLSSYNDGVFEYLLFNGQQITAMAYPILNGIYGSNLPDLSEGGFLRHIDVGSGRNLGDSQDETWKDFGSALTDDINVASSGSIFESTYIIASTATGSNGFITTTDSVVYGGSSTSGTNPTQTTRGFLNSWDDYIERYPPNSPSSNFVLKFDFEVTDTTAISNEAQRDDVRIYGPLKRSRLKLELRPDQFSNITFGTETVPKNVAVQYYVKAKVVLT